MTINGKNEIYANDIYSVQIKLPVIHENLDSSNNTAANKTSKQKLIQIL